MAAIFFDVDGTLVRWEGEYGQILAEAFERVLGSAEEPWLDRYNERFFDHFGDFVDDPYRRAFADVCEAFDLDADPDRLAETLIECEFEAVEPVAGVERIVPELAERHTLGLLTNGIPEVQFGKVERHGLRRYFDVTVASHQDGIGTTKPDAGIYETAKARVDADRYVMIGDDREPDVEGARRHGFDAVHVDADATGLNAPDFETLAALL